VKRLIVESQEEHPTLSWPETGRLAAVDFGLVRIGLALSDSSRVLATPLTTYERQSESQDAEFFRRLVARHEIVGFIVGLPLHADGRESQMSGLTRQFADWLTRQTGCPVRLVDERYTTALADQLLREPDLTARQRKKRVDRVAAQQLLAGYLDACRARQALPDSATGQDS
jgi:putative Holliday junction resolvase